MSVIYPCTRAEYDAAPGINQSLLKHMEQSEFHLKHAMTAVRDGPTPSMILGCLVEHLVLGTEFGFERMAYPDFKTKEAREWRDSLKVPVVTDEIFKKAHAMAARVLAHPEFKPWTNGRSNIGLGGVHNPTGLQMKGLVDAAPDDYAVILDLKTAADASIRGFGRSIVDWGYDVQAWWYQELWRQNFQDERQFVFVVVESEEPFAVSVQAIRQDDIDRAGRAVSGWMERYKRAVETDTWPEYSTGITWAEVPAWRFRDI